MCRRRQAAVDAAGRVTMPYHPGFYAYRTDGSWTPGNVTIVYNNTSFNTGGHYSTSTGRFTAPVTGYYRFFTSMHSSTDKSGRHALYKNGTHWTGSGGGAIGTGDWRQLNLHYIGYISAGDYVSAYCANGAYVHGDGNWGSWGAELLG